MKYSMSAGSLYSDNSTVPVARIMTASFGPGKKIHIQENNNTFKTDITNDNDTNLKPGDIANRHYFLYDQQNEIVVKADPKFANEEEFDESNWLPYRLPVVDHALLNLNNQKYTLTMHNNQNYSLADTKGKTLVTIMHKGITGGWNFEDNHGFKPEILCTLFIFCRYLEKESEFMIV